MRRVLGVVAVPVLVATLAGGCGEAGPQGNGASSGAGPAAQGTLPPSYSFGLTSSCGERSLIGTYRVWVSDDEVVRVEPRGRTPRPARLEDVPTIADLEELIAHVGPDAVVEVERDGDGRLRSVGIDHVPDAVDDEECYTVGDVREEQPLRVSCGGDEPGWPPSAMARGIEAETPREDIEAALRDTEEEMGIDGPFLGARTWIVLAEDQGAVTLGTGRWTIDGPGDDAMVVAYRREGDQLVWSGHGQCLRLAPVLAGDSDWVQVTAPPGGLDRATTDLEVLVMEHQCTGARDPRPFLDEPVVRESPDRVVISWTSRRVEGGATCPGNPAVPRVVELDEPLGDHALLDGSTWPPTEVDAER